MAASWAGAGGEHGRSGCAGSGRAAGHGGVLELGGGGSVRRHRGRDGRAPGRAGRSCGGRADAVAVSSSPRPAGRPQISRPCASTTLPFAMSVLDGSHTHVVMPSSSQGDGPALGAPGFAGTACAVLPATRRRASSGLSAAAQTAFLIRDADHRGLWRSIGSSRYTFAIGAPQRSRSSADRCVLVANVLPRR